MTEDVKNADANAPKKLSIQRRTKTTVSSTTAGGKAKAVQVEVRKKRTVPTDAARKAAEAEKAKTGKEDKEKASSEKVQSNHYDAPIAAPAPDIAPSSELPAKQVAPSIEKMEAPRIEKIE